MPEADHATLRVCVVYSPGPREVLEFALTLQPGSTVLDALRASGVQASLAAAGAVPAGVGLWGRKAVMSQPLRQGDRVEVYRELQVDPKVARRERFQKQGARTAGLFAQLRSNAKAGY